MNNPSGRGEYKTRSFISGQLAVTEYIPVRSRDELHSFCTEITELCLEILKSGHGGDSDDRNLLPSVGR